QCRLPGGDVETCVLLAEQLLAGGPGVAEEGGEQFCWRDTTPERMDERLDEGDGPVVGAGVAPGLEGVKGRDVEVGERGRLVLVDPQVDRPPCPPQGGREAEVG